MEAVINIVLVFFVVLVVATIIERFSEFVSILLNFLEPYIKLDKLWWKISGRIQQRIQRELIKASTSGRSEVQMVVNAIKTTLFKTNVQAGEPVVIQVSLVRGVFLNIIFQIIGIGIGILVAFLADLNVFEMVNELGVTNLTAPPFWGQLITGVLVGCGTSPVHSLIKYSENKKESHKRDAKMAKLRASLNH